MTETIAYLTSAHHAFTGNDPIVSPSQLARVADIAKNRKQRNSLYRYQKLLSSLSEEAKEFHSDNPQANGLPRTYSIRVAKDDDQDQAVVQAIDGQCLIIGKHGFDDSGLNVAGDNIAPSDVAWVPATKSYTFNATFDESSLPKIGSDVAGFISFETTVPTGALAVGNSTFNIQLDKTTTWYDVDVSANAGAYWSSAKSQLIWDTTSTTWVNAVWESSKLTFGYDITNIGDKHQENWVGENMFQDNYTTPATEFNLKSSDYGVAYTCIVGSSTDKGALLSTKITTKPPQPPPGRRSSAVKSVFPVEWTIQLSPFADSFTGAFKDDSGNAYAVKATIRTPLPSFQTRGFEAVAADVDKSAAMKGDASAEEESANHEEESAAHEGESATHEEDSAAQEGLSESQPMFMEKSQPMAQMVNQTITPQLKVFELLSYNPMTPDSKDPSGYRDTIADLAMQDFQHIIVYHMDEDLRKTFISATQISLPPEVLLVANDNPKNADFYKKLQVPLITSILAGGTLDQASHCNGIRADARLKSIPVDDETYKRHASKLYRLRFLDKFPIQKFLNDQHSNASEIRIKDLGSGMKDTLQSKSKGLEGGNAGFEGQLKAAQDSIDRLMDWALKKKLRWAMELLYLIQNSSLRNWYAQYTSGSTSSSIGMFIKQLNGLFGILEDNASNPEPNGKNFTQVFNEDVRLFQMMALVPQLVDVNGNASDIDDLVKECLAQYVEKYKDVNMTEHKDAVEIAMKLHGDNELRAKIMRPLFALTRVMSTVMTWTSLMHLWEFRVQQQGWFKNVVKAANVFKTMAFSFATVLVILPLIPDVRKEMTDKQKIQWGFTLAGILGLIVISVAQKIINIYVFWNDLSKIQILKYLGGSEAMIDAIPNSATRIQNRFTQWFTRTSGQARQLAALPAGSADSLTKFEKIFGRNVGEFLGAVCGLILGIVSIVLICLEMSTKKEGLLQALDIIMLISAGLQVLAVALSWIAAGLGLLSIGGLAGTISVLNLMAAWFGPLAVVFALIGIILIMVWYFTTDHRDPIKRFVEDTARPAGLYMEGSMRAPEYLQVVSPAAGKPSLNGLSFYGPLIPAGSVPGFPMQIDAKYIRLDTANKVAQLSDTLDFTPDTVWSLETDPWGNSFIYTTSKVKDPATNATSMHNWYLGTDDSKNVVVKDMPLSRVGDAWIKTLSSLQWQIDVQEISTVSQDKKSALVAKVLLRQNGKDLGRTIDSQSKQAAAGIALVDAEEFRKSNALAAAEIALGGLEEFWKKNRTKSSKNVPFILWEIALQPLGPSIFKYSSVHWILTTQETNRWIAPQFEDYTSEGLQWSIEPALDANYFQIIDDGSSSAGTIKQKDGVKAPPMSPKKYTVTCALKIGDVTKGTRSTTITIEVNDPPSIPSA